MISDQDDDISHSMTSLPHLSFPEKDAIPMPCWQDISLSKIWIPKCLLPNRKNPSNTWETRGIFHTLEKRGNTKQIESFSTYSDSDNESEVFQSDSDDTFDFNSNSDEFMKVENDLEKSIEVAKNIVSELQSFPVKSDISLNEIIDSNTEVDLTNFEFKKYSKHVNEEEEKWQPNKKNSKKNKIIKAVTLDKFLEEYTEEDRQEAYANDYLHKVLTEKNNDEDEIQLKNNVEFPELNLPSKEIKFIHNDKTYSNKPEITIKAVTKLLYPPDGNENVSTCTEIVSSEPENNAGKIVVENIPSEVSHEDIYTTLGDYGKIKEFTLEPDGEKFLKAFVKINLIGDIDWIVECLNGSELFGTSSRLLKCYKVK